MTPEQRESISSISNEGTRVYTKTVSSMPPQQELERVSSAELTLPLLYSTRNELMRLLGATGTDGHELIEAARRCSEAHQLIMEYRESLYKSQESSEPIIERMRQYYDRHNSSYWK